KIAVHVPQVTFSPEVWETCGSEIIPSIKITTPPHNERTSYRFEYEGDGAVELPDAVVLEPGSTTLAVRSPFRTNPVKETAQGIVRVVWSHPEAGERVVGQWTVVQRPSILKEMRVARADDLVDAEAWDVTYAITVELDPVEEWVEQSINDHRDVTFQASTGGSDSDPIIQVFSDVSSDDYPSFPRELVPAGPYKVFVVCAKRPKHPSRKRPFVQVKARSGGDEIERYLKLPF
ncbi:MAG TPA: hypothetical protein P5218_05255, partial [Planctomycetota bacterium]|nr:hypothetical protein [Planctomycetota bacterium]